MTASSSSSESASQLRPFPETLRIFLVEDNPGDSFIFAEALEESQHHTELQVAESGTQALKLLEAMNADPEHPLPHILVTDLQLPDMEGIDVIKGLRKFSRLQKIPVILMSASDSESDVRRAYEAKADYYVVKPAFVEEFAKIVHSIEKAWTETASDDQKAPAVKK